MMNGDQKSRVDSIIKFLIDGDQPSSLRGAENQRKAQANESEKKLLLSIAEVLVSQGVDNFDPLVLRQLSSFVHNHVRAIMLRALKLQQHRTTSSSSSSSFTSASSASDANSNTTTTNIALKDVQAAVRSWGQNRALMFEDTSTARKQAQKLNRKPLPKIKAVFGMQVPASSRCFFNDEYTVTVVEKPGSAAVEMNSSSSPQNNSGKRRHGRKRRRGRKNSETNKSKGGGGQSGGNGDIDFNRIQPSTKRARTSEAVSGGSSSGSSSSGAISIKIGFD